MDTKNIQQTEIFTGSPEQIYQIWLDSVMHSEFIEAEAKIDPQVGGKFSVFGDYATGANLELVPGQKIVQSWRASDWPAEHFSKITITLTPEGEKNTKFEFVQEDIPAEFYNDIARGWNDYYWQPLRTYLEENQAN